MSNRPPQGKTFAPFGKVVVIGRDNAGTINVYTDGKIIPIRLVLGVLIPVLLFISLMTYVLIKILSPPPGPMKMNSVFNVAVADFGELTPTNKAIDSEQGRLLSQWLFQDLKQEFTEFPNVTVWQDSMVRTEKGVTIGTVPGSNQRQRSTAAATKAADLGADVFIYGTIDDSTSTLAPEFYIRAIDDARESEIRGDHELGQAIPIHSPLTDPANKAEIDDEIHSRGQALSLFVRGIVYDRLNRTDIALKNFELARDSWGNTGGKEITYLFIGWELEKEGHFDLARAAYAQAESTNPNYARAYIGMGNIDYERAQTAPREQRLAQLGPQMMNAVDEYKTAITKAESAQLPWVEQTGHFALGSTYRLLGDAYIGRQDFVTADNFLKMAVDETQNALRLSDNSQPQQLAQTYLGLGAAYILRAYVAQHGRGDLTEGETLYQKAIAAFDNCIHQVDIAPADRNLQDIKVRYCTPYRAVTEISLKDLQAAARSSPTEMPQILQTPASSPTGSPQLFSSSNP